MPFTPPTADQLLALKVNAGISNLGVEPDLVEAIVEGIGAFAAGEWAPLDWIGDQTGSIARDGQVTTPPGFAEAYRAYIEQGWNAISGPEAFGGQGLPSSLAGVVLESLGAANLAFTLLPILTTPDQRRMAGHDEPDRAAGRQ